MSHLPDLCGRALDGRYELHELVGEGTFGRVYRGRDRRLGRRVAVKVLKPWCSEDARWARSLEREAQLLASLNHPGIIQIFDVGAAAEGVYYVAELVEGESLADRLKRGPLKPAQASAIALALAQALAPAHAQGIVHRDIKPANVLIAGDGRVKVGDFGVARLAEGSADTTATAVGTPRYMAPEQASGAPVGSATDVYAVGVLLHEMLAGVPPFDGATAFEIARRHQSEPPPPLPAHVPAGLAEVVSTALRKDPACRYGDGRALAAALRHDRHAPRGGLPRTLVGSAMSPRRTFHPSERRQRVALLAGILVLALGMGGVALALGRGHLRAPKRAAPAAVQVPELVGLPATSARALLEGLKLSASVTEVPAPLIATGTVTRQLPYSGSSLPRGAAVRLSVAEAPRPRALTRLSGTEAASTLPFHIQGRRWEIVYTMAYQGTCTFIVVCSGPTATVTAPHAGGAAVGSFDLSDGARQTRVFKTGPGTYRLAISPGSDTARWQIEVYDYY